MSSTSANHKLETTNSTAESSEAINEWSELRNHPDTDISTIFDRLAHLLAESHGVEKGVMVVCGDNSRPLGVVSVWDQRGLKSGLTLTLPTEDSLFQKVVNSGETTLLTEQKDLTGNFFERKLLLGDSTASMLLIPLSWEGNVVGMLGFSSSAQLESVWSESLNQATAVLAEMVDAQIG